MTVKRATTATALLLMIATLAGCAATAATVSPVQGTAPHSARGALAALKGLRVEGRAPLTGYTREQFGDGWGTVDGCDERDRILARDLTSTRDEPGSDCRVAGGVLADPYTRERIVYTRGASEVDIDHVVALADAWQKGAQKWSLAQRETFANDPLELLAVSAHANRAKGDGDAATWLPPNTAFRCAYVARQIAVKRRYEIWVTQAEHDAMARVLSACPDQRLPTASATPLSAPATSTQPSSTISQPPATTTQPMATNTRPPAANGARVFPNCAAVRAAGLAPLRRGTPEYGANQDLDGDHDGLACE